MSKLYIATAIPYASGKPHIGNAMDWLYGDILTRYYRLQGNEVLFSVGADQHGQKNLEKAMELGLEPKAYVDQMAAGFQDAFTAYDIKPDRFIRTSDEAHKQRVQIIWQKLLPYIYKSKYIGAYCVGCEEFKTETHVKETNGVCPDHDRRYEMLEEENHFFKLSAFTEQIRTAIETDKMKITPAFRKKEALNLLGDVAQDFSITRPKKSVGGWGVEVPGDPDNIIYIWFEALMNYITLLGYPEHQDFKDYWPAHTQVLGSGIARFHTLIWPGVLLSLGLELPKNLYIHGYWSFNGREFSKTTGNVIYPEQLTSVFGSDASRYYNARYLPSHKDGDFTWQKMNKAYNGDLINGLGNVIQRVSKMTETYLNNQLGDSVPAPKYDATPYHQAIAEYHFDRALEWVFSIVDGINKYLEEAQPWQLAKDPSQANQVKGILLNSIGELREVGAYLAPFMPATSEFINKTFGSEQLVPPTEPVFIKVELPEDLLAPQAQSSGLST